jgi:hypothetical protein
MIFDANVARSLVANAHEVTGKVASAETNKILESIQVDY